MKDNNAGKPSIIFNRYHEKDKTKIRRIEINEKDKLQKTARKWLGMMTNANWKLLRTIGQ